MQRKEKPKKMPRKLEKAIKANDVAMVKTILAEKKFEHPEWLNAINGRDRTGLLLAVKYKCWEVAKLLLSFPSTNVNVSDHNGKTALELVANNFAMVQLLLTDARLKTPGLQTAKALLRTYYENESRFLVVLQLLIAKCIGVNVEFGGKATALWWASVNNQPSVVKFLLAQPYINVNKCDSLAKAMRYGNLEVVKLLLADQRTDVNRCDDKSILTVAIQCRDLDERTESCIKLLLCHPNLDKKWIEQKIEQDNHFLEWVQFYSQKSFNQIIGLASTKMSRVENKKKKYNEDSYNLRVATDLKDAIKVLVDDPEFDINELYYNGQTLLTMAISEQLDDIVNMLLACPRIEIHKQDKFGHSALTQADASGRTDYVNNIMQHPRFKLLVTYHHGQNLLMHAAEKDCAGLVKEILSMREFPVNHVDDQGNTALNLLAQHHHNPRDASLFIEFIVNGADPTLRNKLGTNAIMSAENNALKGIASDLKNAVQPFRQPQLNQVVQPSAPPLEEVERESIAAAAEQPPQRYYEQGLFGASTQVSASPRQEFGNTDSFMKLEKN